MRTKTIDKLKEHAAENRIDISGATRKDEIVRAIRRGKKLEE